MIVYRLEEDNEEHRGPFCMRAKSWPMAYDSYTSLHQSNGCTISIFKRLDSSIGRFGCRNITQLYQYFGETMGAFLDDGWVIGVYKVNKHYTVTSREDIELQFDSRKAIRLGDYTKPLPRYRRTANDIKLDAVRKARTKPQDRKRATAIFDECVSPSAAVEEMMRPFIDGMYESLVEGMKTA